MKKVLFTILMSLMISNIAGAQTKGETIRFIESRVGDNGEYDVLDSLKMLTEESIDYDGVSPIGVIVLFWKDVSAITYLLDGNYWVITISGKAHRYLYVNNEMYKKKINPEPPEFKYKNREFGKEGPGGVNVRIILRNSVAETEVKKIVKALTHMVELNNAKLLNEDLFN